jgi:hypothetical protein
MKCGESNQIRLAAAIRLGRETKYFAPEHFLWRELCEVSFTDPSPKNRQQLLCFLVEHDNYRYSAEALLQRAISTDPSDEVRETARVLLEELWS